MARPDGDWIPILMYELASGGIRRLAIPGMTPCTLGRPSRATKAVLPEAEAVQAALALPAWFTENDDVNLANNKRILGYACDL